MIEVKRSENKNFRGKDFRKDKELEELKKKKMSFPKLYSKKQLRMLHIEVRFGI